jgi:hypothetical protein
MTSIKQPTMPAVVSVNLDSLQWAPLLDLRSQFSTPSLVRERRKRGTYMNTIQKVAVAICVAGAFQLQVSSTVKAQEAQDAAPAQSLLTVHPLLPGGVPEFNLSNTQSNVHILPTPNAFNLLRQFAPPLQSGPLVYHSGGSIMPSVTNYVIYWVPPSLQNGGPTSLSPAYQAIETRLMKDYPAHGIDNNNTQYKRLCNEPAQ